MKVSVPKPPSTNHFYGITSRGGIARMYITKAGQEWITEAGLLMKIGLRRRKPIATPIEVYIDFYTARRQDVDGIVKPVLDLLQKTGVIENDVLIYRLCVEKNKCKVSEERVDIEIMGHED